MTSGSIEYRVYIQSEAWRKRSDEVRAARGQQCEQCDRTESLGVHHVSYERLGNESDADLEVLCVECHASAHCDRLVTHGNVCSVVKVVSLPVPGRKSLILSAVFGVVGRGAVIRLREGIALTEDQLGELFKIGVDAGLSDEGVESCIREWYAIMSASSEGMVVTEFLGNVFDGEQRASLAFRLCERNEFRSVLDQEVERALEEIAAIAPFATPTPTVHPNSGDGKESVA